MDIDDYSQRAKELEYKMEMEKLGTSLTIMTPEEVEENYIELLEERDSYRYIEKDGIEVSEEALKLNKDKIELVERYAQSSSEIQALLQAQKEKYSKMEEKRKQTEKYFQEDMEYEEMIRNTPSEEIDSLLEKEVKSKEAREAGFEINEYGEIIRPAEQPTAEELENMSEEELQETLEKNNRIIDHNNKTLKKSLVERILDQQKTISEQQQEIMKLNSQNKEL